MTDQHTAVAALLAQVDPHRGHESDDVWGHPHPRMCLTCSDEDAGVEVEYFLLDVDDEMLADFARQAIVVHREIAAWMRDRSIATIRSPLHDWPVVFAEIAKLVDERADAIGAQHGTTSEETT